MGAVTAIMATAENPVYYFKITKEITNVIVADSPFTSIKQVCLDIGER